MARRYAIAAGALAAIIAALLLWRGPDRAAPDRLAGSASTARPEPQRTAPRALRPVQQQPAVALAPPPDAAPAAPATAGAFEGRVVSAPSGKGLPGAQLTFARAEETSSTSAGPDGAFRFEARVQGRWFLAAATAAGHQPFAPEWGQSPVLLDARPGEVVRGITTR